MPQLGHHSVAAIKIPPSDPYEEDVRDASGCLILQYGRLPLRYRLLRETTAAYSGYDLSLCSNDTELHARKPELNI